MPINLNSSIGQIYLRGHRRGWMGRPRTWEDLHHRGALNLWSLWLACPRGKRGSYRLSPHYAGLCRTIPCFPAQGCIPWEACSPMENGGCEMSLIVLPTRTDPSNHSPSHWTEAQKGRRTPEGHLVELSSLGRKHWA